MLSSIATFVKWPLQAVGFAPKNNFGETTEVERELERRVLEKFKKEVTVFKEHKGFVTQLSNNSIELDHRFVYQLDVNDRFSVGDRVSYKVYKTLNNYVVKDVASVLEKEQFVSKTVSGIIVKVDGNKFEICKNIVFELDKVRSEFLPMLHDFVVLEGDFPKDKDDPEAFDLDYSFFIAKRVAPCTSKLVTGTISSFNPATNTGLIGNDVVFHQNVCDKFVPRVGDSIVCNAISGNYEGEFKWRAENLSINQSHDSSSRHFIIIAPVPKFTVVIGETKIVEMSVSNHSKYTWTVESITPVANRNQSLPSVLNEPRPILPQTTITFPIDVVGEKLGSHMIKLKWFFSKKPRTLNLNSSIRYDTVEQNLGVGNNYDCVQNDFVKRSITIPGQSRVRRPVFRKVPLKEYIIPEKLYELLEGHDNFSGMVELQIALQKEKPILTEGLCAKNYDDWMHTLLFLEELAEEKFYKNLACRDFLFKLRGGVVFNFPADSDHSRIVCGDVLIASEPWEKGIKYEGKIWETTASQIFCKFNPQFEETMQVGVLYDLIFVMNRTGYKRRHQAVDLVLKNVGVDWLFPSVKVDEEPEISDTERKNSSFKSINTRLNDEQKRAVGNILAKRNLPNPYIIYGPPGTGKTMTVMELILQVYTVEPNCRILVGAPTNSAVDTLGSRLLGFGVLNKEDMIRLSSYNAYRQGQIATQLIDISYVPQLGDRYEESSILEGKDETPTLSLSDLGKHKITIGTLSTLSILNSAGLSKGFFTHVIIDESGQCHEPETLLPIALIDPTTTQLVLAGDPMQLGPTISSRLAVLYNFNQSLLDRFTSSYLYKKKVDTFETTCGYNPRLITRLVYNYRSLPKIVDLIGGLFYENDLRPIVSESGTREGEVLRTIDLHGYGLGTEMDSNIFINVNFKEERIDDNFSWFNSGEILQVLRILNSLYDKGISPDDIGVITPYSLQVRKIYEMLDSMNIFSPKVASVEEFQGQERDIIIISLVRNNMGISKKLSPFVCDSQRINVALSRARLLNVIIGHRNTLASNRMWADILSKCKIINLSPNMENDNPDCS